MSDKSHIEWTDATWPVVTGCERISPGCAHCYAVRDGWRLSHNPNPKVAAAYEDTVARQGNGQLDWTGHVHCLVERLEWPLKWQAARQIFVCNESDLFFEKVPDTFIAAVFGVMYAARRHTYQVLTKRPAAMRLWFINIVREAAKQGFGSAIGEFCAFVASKHYGVDVRDENTPTDDAWPLPNVWLGTSVENQPYADERIPQLLQTPAAVRFISAEPLLGPVSLSDWLHAFGWPGICRDIDGNVWHEPGSCPQCRPGLDWVIVGGESGSGARPFDLAWARSIVAQCEAADVPCFIKQLGANPRFDLSRDSTANLLIRGDRFALKDRKGGDAAEWPADLQVRQYPEART